MTRTGLGRATLGLALALLGCSSSEDPSPGSSEERLPYARHVVEFSPGENAGFGQDRLPEVVLGPPDGHGLESASLDVLSLGIGGSIVLDFGDRVAQDGPGPDLLVFENPFYPGGDPESVFAEPGEVSVSLDGLEYRSFPCDPDPPHSGCAGVTPTLEYDAQEVVPLDPEVTGGDRFDLADVGLENARYVRITDLGSEGAAGSAGFDLDAIGLIGAD